MKKWKICIVLLATVILSGCSNAKEFSNEEIEQMYFNQRIFTSVNSIASLISAEELNSITKDYLSKTFSDPELSLFETSYYSEYFGSSDTTFSINIESYGYLYQGPEDAKELYKDRQNDSYYKGKVFSFLSDIGEGTLVSTKETPDSNLYQIDIKGIIFTNQSQFITFNLVSSDEPYLKVNEAEYLAKKIADRINQNYQNMRI